MVYWGGETEKLLKKTPKEQQINPSKGLAQAFIEP